MKVTATNQNLVIEDYTSVDVARLTDLLSYKDKAKQYQLRRMAANPFSRNSPLFKKIKSEVEGCLLVQKDNKLIVPSGFIHHFKNSEIIDKRCDTGVSVAYPWVKKPYDMRDYQVEGFDLMQANYRGLINFATGLGKTLLAIHAIRKFKKKTLVLCPSTSIADNFYKELCSAFGDNKVGYFGDGKKQIRDITVGLAQSVNNHIEKFKAHGLGLVIIDEVHHVPANTFFTIADQLSSVGRMFGLTATNFRADGKDVMITAGVGEVLIERDLIWGIKNGWLAYPYVIMRRVQTTGKSYKNDKNKNYKEHVLKSNEMTNQIIKDINKIVKAGKNVLCLVDEIEHGAIISKAVGLKYAHGKEKDSQLFVDELNDGTIAGLIGTDSKIGEGTDTRRVDVLVLANFVAGKGPFWQNLGRGLRLYGTKTTLLVLDYSPQGSDMMARHAEGRLEMYSEITSDITVID